MFGGGAVLLDQFVETLLHFMGSLLGRKRLGGAVYNHSILHTALDKPVRVTATYHAVSDAIFAEIIIAVITDAAVIVNIVHRLVAFVAVYLPASGHNRGCRNWLLFARIFSLSGDGSEVCEECITVSPSGDVRRYTNR